VLGEVPAASFSPGWSYDENLAVKQALRQWAGI
jgi:hypothetical protein